MNGSGQNRAGLLIKSICSSEQNYFLVKELFNICHKLAVVHLRNKYQNGYQLIFRFGLTLEDIALDCVAELFRRDDKNNFIEFNNYFNKLRVEEFDDTTGIIYLRRLVCGQVEQRLFRIKREYDPSLGKIIRNIKLTIDNTPLLKIDKYFEQKIITLSDYSLSNDFNPVQSIELLRITLHSISIRNITLRNILNEIGVYLSELEEYKKIIPVVELALIIRTISLSKTFSQTETSLEENITSVDLEQITQQVLEKMKKIIGETYIKKSKLSDDDAAKYLNALNNIICEAYSIYPSQTDHFYEHLTNYFPGLTKEGYMENHRTKFEYLVKIAKQEINAMLKKEYFSL